MRTEDNLDLIRKVTWSFVKKHPGLEFDDLFSEASIACLEAEHKYDPDRGDKSTFIWRVVSNRLTKLLSQDVRYHETEMLHSRVEYADEVSPSPEQELMKEERWAEMVDSMSVEAQSICELAIHGEEYLPVDKPKKCRGQIIQMLRDSGWSWSRIWSGLAEVKQQASAN